MTEQATSICDSNMAYGCLFCSTGKEEKVVDLLMKIDGLHMAITPKQIQHRSVQGRKFTVERTLLPSYVFFLADKQIEISSVYRLDHVLRLLRYEDGWALQGRDLEFATWIFSHDGMLGMSKVYRIGERIVITDGPLKELEGTIERIDRHNRNGLVSLDFDGKQLKVWLAFEYVTEAKT